MVRQAASRRRVFVGSMAVLILALNGLVAGPGFGDPVEKGIALTEGEALEQAEEAGEPVQVLELTTQDTIVYANPDGTFTAELASGPVRVPDPANPTGWSNIDVSLEEGPDGLQPQFGDADIVFSDGGPGQAATISEDGLSFAVGSEETLPTPAVNGDTATYPEVLPGIDLTLQARPGGFEQSYVIAAPPAETLVFDLPLSLVGVTVEVQDGGNLVVTDAAGSLVAQASPAVMFGAEVDPHTDEPVHSALVPTAIVQGPDGPVLRVSPDPGFFATPGLAYPVTVDPAPDFSVDVDTFVSSAAPTTSYGSDQQLKSGVNGSDVHRTLISFAATGILEHNRVLSATLKLWEIHSYSCTASTVEVYDASAALSSTTTWNTQPAAGTLYASASVAHGFSSSCPNAWVNLSTGGVGGRTLTRLVQEWAWGAKIPHGLVVRAGSETDPNGWKKFSSSDAGSNAPLLSVTYDSPPPDASDSEDGVTGWAQDILSSPENYVTDQLGGGCQNDDPSIWAYGSYKYKTFISKYDDLPYDMKLDEFDPPSWGGQRYPVLILAHGGGWVSGCRGVVAKEARLFAGQTALQNGNYVAQKFIVFSVDYRLACRAGDYPLLPPLADLCGWRWNTADPEGQRQVAVHDIEDVIRWIKDPDGWQTPGSGEKDSNYLRWNRKDIFVLGASSGGNVVAQAAANSATDSTIRPTAAAFLSGFPETGQTDTGAWSCDSDSSDTEGCWEHLNNYLGCLVDGVPPGYPVESCKGEEGRYENASPLNGPWNFSATPPMFVANAGYPLGGNNRDLSPLQLAVDFTNKLLTRGYDEDTNPPSLKLCQVASGGHATGYLDKWSPPSPNTRRCEGDSGEVIESLVAFFVANLVP